MSKTLLKTNFSSYTIDYDNKTIVRHNETEMGLRKDDEPITFSEIEEPVVGQGCMMLLEIVPGFVTIRFTSDVVSITSEDSK